MRLNWILAGAFLLCATPPLAAQHDRDESDDFRSRIDTTLTLDRGGTVDLSLVSGRIDVRPGGGNQVRLRARSEEGVLQLDASSSRITLGVRSVHGDMGDTEYDVSVPAGTRVLTNSVSGDISLAGGGEVEAHTVSGEIVVRDAGGRATTESVSGGVEATHIGGGLRVSTVSGDVRATGVQGDVEAQTVSGEVELHDIVSSFVRASSTSGDVTFDGKTDPNGRYELHSHSGDVQIALEPGLAGATFDVETFSGDIDSGEECAMTIQPGNQGGRGRRVHFTVGKGGGARYTLETFSGDITITGCTSR